jgi:hypothetical protein
MHLRHITSTTRVTVPELQQSLITAARRLDQPRKTIARYRRVDLPEIDELAQRGGAPFVVRTPQHGAGEGFEVTVEGSVRDGGQFTGPPFAAHVVQDEVPTPA